MKKSRLRSSFIMAVFIIIFFFSFMIFLRIFTIKILKIDNAFTEFVFGEIDEAKPSENVESTDIDWQVLYPFAEDSKISGDVEKNVVQDNLIVQKAKAFTEKIEGIKLPLNSYATDLLFGYKQIVEAAKKYDNFLGWNFASYSEYNGTVQLSDGHMTSYIEKKDTSENAQSIINFANECKKSGRNFLYVQAPHKICQYEDSEISGTVDFSNQNADSLLKDITNAGVDSYDLREAIHDEGLDHHALFYKSDHHWLTTTGLWASQKILKYCNTNYGFQSDLSLLDLERFEIKTYPEWFLGSFGKKVTLARTQPDDFQLLYPRYETEFHYRVAKENIDAVHDYSVVYDMEQIDEKDYYNKNPYAACNYGDQPLICITNKQDTSNKKIFILHDSFGDCVISCLALGVKDVISLDLRHFNGSVQNYIDKENPDLVVVLYNPTSIEEIDWTTHLNTFDFR